MLLTGTVEAKGRTIDLKANPVYKSVSIWNIIGETRLKLKESVQAWLNGALNDPIVKILAENSQLSKIQLETLLIDVLAENIAGKYLKYESKENVVKSIYTVLLLGYLGIFESTTLDPYIEIANKLKDYVEAHNDMPNNEKELKDHLKVIEIIREELETSLKQLSTP
jgi:hypothetical protein